MGFVAVAGVALWALVASARHQAHPAGWVVGWVLIATGLVLLVVGFARWFVIEPTSEALNAADAAPVFFITGALATIGGTELAWWARHIRPADQ